MSAKGLMQRIAGVANRYNAAQAGVPAKMRREFLGWDSFQLSIQSARIEQGRGFVRDDFTEETNRLARSIGEEKTELPLEVARVKFPLTTSSDNTKKLLGETQINTARLFLSIKPSAAVLLAEIRMALTLNRLDYAWTLYDTARQSIPEGVPTQEQFQLKTGLDDIAATLSTSKLAELEAELAAFPDVERIAAELQRQIVAGAEVLYLPDLFPLMTEAEQKTAAGGSQFNLTEAVLSEKRRKAAAY